MKVLILAAGEGSRLRPLTNEVPKCLVQLKGHPLLDYQLKAFHNLGIDDISIVTGYRNEALDNIGLRTFHNSDYADTNMVFSMMAAEELFTGNDDLIVTYSDIVFESRVISNLTACDKPLAISVNTDWLPVWKARFEDPLEDAETLRMDSHGNLLEIGKKPKSLTEIEGQYMGIIKIRKDKAQDIAKHYHNMNQNILYDGRPFPKMFMTSFLQNLIDTGFQVTSVPTQGGWLEVDSLSDLNAFETMSAEGKLDDICSI